MTSLKTDRHAPALLRTYLRAHHNHMAQLLKGAFVQFDNLEWDPEINTISGAIACAHNVVIAVNKTLKRLDDSPNPMVQTTLYAYNAHIVGVREIYRVDNSHPYPGHHDRHHEHIFLPTGEEVRWVGYDNWPTLSDFIRKVQQLCETTFCDELPPAGAVVTEAALAAASAAIR